MPHLAHRQGVDDGVHRVLQGGARFHHGGDDFGGQGGQDIGFHTAAQAVGEDDDHVVPGAHHFHLIAAELFVFLIEAFESDVKIQAIAQAFLHPFRSAGPASSSMRFLSMFSVTLVSAVVSPSRLAIS